MQFTLPAVPAGCTLSGATFELSQGRLERAHHQRFPGFVDLVGYHFIWSTQPSPVAAPPWVSAPTAPAGELVRDRLVQPHYAGTNTGFVVHDTWRSSAEKVQKYRSCEGGPATRPN